MSDSPSVPKWRGATDARTGEPRLSDARRRRGTQKTSAGGVPRLSRTDPSQIDEVRAWLTASQAGSVWTSCGRPAPATNNPTNRALSMSPSRGKSIPPTGSPSTTRSARRCWRCLRRLSPGERVAFVLHDVSRCRSRRSPRRWAGPFGTCRQLARRARAKFSGASRGRPTSAAPNIRFVTERFITACANRRLASADGRGWIRRMGRRHDSRRLRPPAPDQSRPREVARPASLPGHGARWSPDRSENGAARVRPNAGCSRCWC